MKVGSLDPPYGVFSRPFDPPQPPLKRGEKTLKVPLFKGDLGGSSKCSRKVDSYAKSQFILKITFNSYANFAKVSADESDPITLYVT